MKTRTVAQFLGALILAPILSFSALYLIALLTTSGSVDPEGAVLLAFVTAWSMPGVAAGIVAAHLAAPRLEEFPWPVGFGLSVAAGGFVSAFVFPAVWAALGLWQYFDDGILIPAALTGLFGSAVLLVLEKFFSGESRNRRA